MKDFEQYLIFRERLSKNSISSYISDVSIFLKTSIKLKEYIIKISSIYKKSTIARKISAFKKYYKFQSQEIPQELLDFQSHQNKKLPTTLSKKNIQFLHKSILQFGNLEDLIIFETLILTGGRISEILNISLNDIDEKNEMLKLYGKGNKIRFVPITLSMAKKLIKFIQQNEKFKISRNNYWNRLKKYGHKIGLEVHIHQLRHSVATIMLEEGGNLLYIKELLGHEKVDTVAIYTHVSNKQLRKIYDEIF